MNLKEAFRYQNFLDNITTEVTSHLSMQENLVKYTKLHKRNEVNPDAEDFTEELDRSYCEIPMDDLAEFAIYLIEVRGAVSRAITEAKKTIPFDVDAAREENKVRQAVARYFKRMLKVKVGTTEERQNGYKFNAEGNQVPYVYNVDVTTAHTFDDDHIKSRLTMLYSEADNTSHDIDDAMVNTKVQFYPPFDVNGDMVDCYNQYAANK